LIKTFTVIGLNKLLK